MPGYPEDDVRWAVLALIDNARHLPAPLAEELRKYQPAPDDSSADLVRQRYACSVLLDRAGLIPDPLEAELDAYVLQLDHALNTRIVQPDMTDTDFLDAVAGILRSPQRGQRILEDIRDLVKRSGRGSAGYRGYGSSIGTVTDIRNAVKEGDPK